MFLTLKKLLLLYNIIFREVKNLFELLNILNLHFMF